MLRRVRFLGLLAVGVGLMVACSRSGFEDQYLPDGGVLVTGGAGGVGTGGTGAVADSGPEFGGVGGGGFGGTGVGGFGGTGFGGTGFGGTGVGGTGFGGTGFGGTGVGGTGFGGTGFGGTGPIDSGPTGGFGGTGFGGTGFGGTGGGPTDGGNFFDAFPFPDSGPIHNCVQCADQSCNSQVNACYNDPTCASGVVCALTSCLGGGGGGLDFGCVISCFGGNFSAAGKALQAFLCVGSNCGQQCVGAIAGGGGPGGGGGPPPPPGPTPGGSPATFSPVAGGYLLTVPADKASALGVPAGTMYVPPLDVLDGVTPTCGGSSGSCR